MSYAVIQNAITKDTQEQSPDGLISKVGNDSYPTIDDARTKWHQQCVSLKNDADTFGDDKEAAGRPNEQNYAQSYCAG